MTGAAIADQAGVGVVDLEPARITRIVRAATGRPDAEPSRWWTEPVAYPVGSWATAGLSRVRGIAVSGGKPMSWSVFVKELRSPRGFPVPDGLPAGSRDRLRAMAATDRTWRHEADVYRAELDDVLPPVDDALRLTL